MKKKILFVDDEVKILQAARRMLREKRNEWEMAFAESGQQALEILSREPFDVVVSDIRMAGMDGPALLNEVMRLYPNTVRIVLSGQSSPQATLRCVRSAHQFLSKPCEAETIKSTIERACALNASLAEDSVKRVVAQMESCPSMPYLYAQVVEEIGSPNSSVKNVGKIVSKDPGMTAKILQLVNSAFFGFFQHIADPVQAVTLIGLESLMTMILSLHIFSAFDERKLERFSLDRLWAHSNFTAAYAKWIAKKETQDTFVINDAFAAGLLHDLGRLVLANNFSDQYENAVSLVRDKGMTSWEAEFETFGTTHAEIGAYLLGIWGIPQPIIEAIIFHHSPGRCVHQKFSALTAVYAANTFDHEDHPEDIGTGKVDSAYLSNLDMSDHLSAWKEICGKVREYGEKNGK
ncbi:MAG TPA: response regulator [Thermodesulfobacteriota bacterium]|nr:response regulator [Thermodesulfobacteriota bacterium]